MRDTGLRDSESAVSEVVDFAIMLGMMLIAVSMIVVYGYPLINHMQETGHTENVRQSFTVLKANFNKIVFGEAPSQSVELKMYEGALSVTGDSNINVSCRVWNESSSSFETQIYDRQMRMIENEYEGTTICYENTGVWTQYTGGSALMVSEPHFTFTDERVVIPIAMIAGSDSTSGTGLVSIIAIGSQPSIHNYHNVSQLDLTIKSKYYKGWESYLSEEAGMNKISTDEVNNTVHLQKQYSENIDVHVLYSPMTTIIE